MNKNKKPTIALAIVGSRNLVLVYEIPSRLPGACCVRDQQALSRWTRVHRCFEMVATGFIRSICGQSKHQLDLIVKPTSISIDINAIYMMGSSGKPALLCPPSWEQYAQQFLCVI
jgi:hypothetical protein